MTTMMTIMLRGDDGSSNVADGGDNMCWMNVVTRVIVLMATMATMFVVDVGDGGENGGDDDGDDDSGG